jgi:hypothetical protein
MMSRRSLPWASGPTLLLAIAIGFFSVPTHLEGPVLVPISPGHAISLLDSVALVPLVAAVAWFGAGMWRRRDGLRRRAIDAPGSTSAAAFLGGLGLGLLIASAFSTFWWWWAIGAAVFGVVLLAAAWAARTG